LSQKKECKYIILSQFAFCGDLFPYLRFPDKLAFNFFGMHTKSPIPMRSTVLLLLALIGLNLQDLHTQTQSVVINVAISGLGGNPISFQMSFDGWATSGTYTTDNNGNYSDTFQVNMNSGTQGTVSVMLADCNGSTLQATGTWNPANNVVNFTFSYCSNSGGGGGNGGGNTGPCNAYFTATQGSANSGNNPQPFTIYVYNQSTGSGLSYFWDFGDGATSNSQFPSHTYSAPGSYLLCLTVTGQGCTSTYCDSVGMDSLGNMRAQGGFTIHVVADPLSAKTTPNSLMASIVPNPVGEHFTLQLNRTFSGPAQAFIISADGRIVQSSTLQISAGMSGISFSSSDLAPGAYYLRIDYDQISIVKKFMK
jgi:hypothetical protein